MVIRGLGANPVEWHGVGFRSTTEATYAAFFDLLSLPWEYEPRDTWVSGWWPDFVLSADDTVYVEVKPVVVLDRTARRAITKARKAISDGDNDMLNPVNSVVLWLAPAEISGHLNGWTCDYRIRRGDRYATWGATGDADLADMFGFVCLDGHLRTPHGGGQLALDGIYDGNVGSAEPNYANLWNKASRTIAQKCRPAAPPWHPKDDPAPAKCDGGADCECDPYSGAHECPACGEFKKRQFDTCYSCR